MSVIRVNKTKNYTVMSNCHLKDRSLSLKAKGLLSIMLSLPEDWDYSVAGLVSICCERESAVNSTLNELKKYNYLRVDKLMPNETESGRIEYVYNIFEFPQVQDNQNIEIQEVEKQDLENLGVEIQGVENQVQYNTNIYNTNKLNTNNKNTKKESKKVSKKENSFDAIIDSYTKDEETKMLLGEWLKVRKSKRAAMTDYAISLNINKLDELAEKSNMSVNVYLKEIIARGWNAFYEIKNFNNQNTYNNNSNQSTPSKETGYNYYTKDGMDYREKDGVVEYFYYNTWWKYETEEEKRVREEKAQREAQELYQELGF